MDDVKFMQDTVNWPNWPFLTVKKYYKEDGVPDVGLMIDGYKATVYHVNMWELGANPDLDSDVFKNAKKSEYSSYEEAVDDGWIVD
jgi:hypothetical protein